MRWSHRKQHWELQHCIPSRKCSFTKSIQRNTCLHRQGNLTFGIFYLYSCEKLFYKERKRDRECKALQYTTLLVFLKQDNSSWTLKELIKCSHTISFFLCSAMQNSGAILLSEVTSNTLWRLTSWVKISDVHNWLWSPSCINFQNKDRQFP